MKKRGWLVLRPNMGPGDDLGDSYKSWENRTQRPALVDLSLVLTANYDFLRTTRERALDLAYSWQEHGPTAPGQKTSHPSHRSLHVI